ncbi:multicopy suppressor of BFA (Brefeldin A) [Batrachochytrium dendrobatidis]
MTVESAPVATTDKKRPQKPNQDRHNAEIQEIRNEIAELQQKMKEIQDKIPEQNTGDAVSTRKNELREKLSVHLQEIKELAGKRTKLVDQLTALQSALKKSEIEKQIQFGQVKLIDEKRMVSEISNLKKVRKVLEGYSQQQTTNDNDKAAIETLRAELKTLDGQRASLRELADTTRAELNKVAESLSTSRESLSGLLEQKRAIKSQVDAAFEKMRTLRSNHKIARDEFYNWEQEERQKRQEQFKQKQSEEREARIVAQAERELEDADIPAFTEEINLCSALIHFLSAQVGSSESKTGSAASTPVSRPTTTSTRAVDESLPSGATVMVRKGDNDDDFMVLGKKGKKGNKGGKSGSGTSTDGAKARPVRLDILTVNQLIALKIDIPVSSDNVPATLASLNEKKQAFLSEQAAQTAANKQAAQARIAQLREAAKAEEMNA